MERRGRGERGTFQCMRIQGTRIKSESSFGLVVPAPGERGPLESGSPQFESGKKQRLEEGTNELLQEMFTLSLQWIPFIRKRENLSHCYDWEYLSVRQVLA